MTGVTDSWFVSELAVLRARGGVEIRLDARDLMEPATLFRTFARVFDFPGYFGHNWDALADCLTDLHGIRHGEHSIAVLIENAEFLLSAEHLGLFLDVLCQAAWQVNLRLDADGMPQDEPPSALHFVLLTDKIPADTFITPLGDRPGLAITRAGERVLITLPDDFWLPTAY
ncbi:barstar family protein [Nocardia yamanashiensis]|uniref:barstar family protein n=1 Tax=Nocardia yamanashiensis TaxID=209247 RepID=UPI0038CD7DB0